MFFLLCFFRDVFFIRFWFAKMVEWTRGRRERLISSWWSLILTAAAGATLAILTKHNTSFRVALFFCCCCCSLFSINSIQFNSLCAILRAPVCEYIFMYPFMKMCTQPGLTRQTSQETFARCLSLFFCTKDFALKFCAGFYTVFFCSCPLLPHRIQFDLQ